MKVNRIVLILMLIICSSASVLVHGYTTKDNLLKNGDLKQDKDNNGVPDHWTRNILLPGSKAKVVLIKNKNGNCVKINFLHTTRMLQARIYQKFTLTPGKVYELKYEYKTAPGNKIWADVMLTGTGILYRCFKQAPSLSWTKRKVLFMVPSSSKGKAGIYVQNRSVVPIWYRNISFKETNISHKELKNYQPKVFVQPVCSDDQLLMPGANKKNADFLMRLKLPSAHKNDFYATAKLLAGAKDIVKLDMGKDRISIPRNIIPDGTSTLVVEIFDKKDKSLIASAKIDIERIAAKALTGNLDLREAPVFKDKDGHPFFSIGMYGVHVFAPKKDFEELKNAGFNTVHSYAFEGRRSADMKRLHHFLNVADKHGLKVIAGLPRQYAEKSTKVKQLEKWIGNIKDHPAVLFYYSDEMYCVRHISTKIFKSTYNIIKKVDPKRKWIMFETPEQKLAPYLDGIMIGVRDANTAKLLRIRFGDKKPVIEVFGQSDHKAEKAPSLQEMQYNVFMPVILGARGIFYWWHPTLKWEHGQKELLKERLYSCTKILSKVAPALVSDSKLPAWTKQLKITGQVKYCTGNLQNTTYVLAGVQKMGKAGKIEFKVPSGYYAECMLNSKQTYKSEQLCSISLKPGEISLIKISRSK